MMELSEVLSPELEDFIRDEGFIMPDEDIVSYTKAGEGNMNFVIRLKTDIGSLILKQSRPYVYKYPQIAAPIKRIEVENKYYELISAQPILRDFSPQIFDFNREHHILVMQDLGQSTDFMDIYTDQNILTDVQKDELIKYLVSLHTISHEKPILNDDMKKLNHEHIFIFPFEAKNGFDLDTVQPGLQKLASKYTSDVTLKDSIRALGERYLSNGTTLVHGDFYPGSWLNTTNGIKVIDPEFSFMGDAEFDLGVLMAHLYLAEFEDNMIKSMLQSYGQKREYNLMLLNKYTGVEILRRILGLAQLPLPKNLERKEALCEMAVDLIV